MWQVHVVLQNGVFEDKKMHVTKGMGRGPRHCFCRYYNSTILYTAYCGWTCVVYP